MIAAAKFISLNYCKSWLLSLPILYAFFDLRGLQICLPTAHLHEIKQKFTLLLKTHSKGIIMHKLKSTLQNCLLEFFNG